MSEPNSKQPVTPPTPTRIRWLVFGLACTTSWLLYLHRYSWGIIKPTVKATYGFSDSQLGWLDSAFNASYAIFQIPGGVLGDLLGPAMVLPAIIFGWSICVVATGVVSHGWSFALVRTLFGLAQAGAYSNLSKVTQVWFPLSVRTTVQGLVGSFSGRAGGASAALLVGSLLVGWLGMPWQQAMFWLAGAGCLFAGVFRLLFYDTPILHPWVNQAECSLIGTGESLQQPVDEIKTRFDRSPKAILNISFLMLHAFASAGADMLYLYWIPLFLQESKGFQPIEMGIFASLPLWGGAAGGAFAGFLNDRLIRVKGKRFARTAVGFTGKLSASLLVLVSFNLEDGRWAMITLAAAKFLTDWSLPTVWGTITDIAGPAAGRVFGTVNMSGSIGAFFAGPVLGNIKEHFGWSKLFHTVSATYVFSALCWIIIDATQKVIVVTKHSPKQYTD